MNLIVIALFHLMFHEFFLKSLTALEEELIRTLSVQLFKRLGRSKKHSISFDDRRADTEDDGPTFVQKPVVHEKIFHYLCPKN